MGAKASALLSSGVHRGSPGAIRSAVNLGLREIRSTLRTPAAFLPGLFIPVFFYFVQVGALASTSAAAGFPDYKGFFLPVSILFAVSNGGAGLNMVSDIESGYFDKLMLTPAPRFSLLTGAMGADLGRVFLQGLFVGVVAVLTGLDFATGPVGLILMIVIASMWGFAYSAIGFAIALKTGNAQATQSAFVLFFPFVFLTTSFAPMEALSGWLQTAAKYNPITYLLAAMRSLSMVPPPGTPQWDVPTLLVGLAAIGLVGSITLTFALRALRGRVR